MTPSNYLNSSKNQKTRNSSLETFGSQSNQTNMVSQKETKEDNYTNSLKEGKLSLSQNDFKNAKKAFLSAFSSKKTVEIAHLLSTCFSNLKEYEHASEFFEKNLPHYLEVGPYWGILALHHYLIEDDEGAAGAALNAIEKFNIHIPEIWKIFAYSAKKLNQADLLFDICKKHSKSSHLNPYIIEGYITGCCSTNRYEEALEFIKSIGLTRDNVLKFGEISSSLCTMVAAIIEKTSNNIEEELNWNILANKLNPDNSPIRWNLSLSQLKNGQIDIGASNYDARFNCKEFVSPIDKFRKPRWNKDVDSNSTILLWYEQGIGDELRFLSALPLFIENFPNVIVEPSDKLLRVIENSFPNLEVRKSAFYEGYTDRKEDFDYHLPIASMFTHVLKKYSDELKQNDFALDWSFLRADPLRKNFWQSKLQAMSDKPKIGFCWRSSVTNDLRNHNYTVLEQWNELLTTSEFSFVNLQYDLDHEQLITQYPEVEELFLDTGHLDQRDDLEGALSLISNLDFVIIPAATPGMMASASGVPTLIYHKPGFWNFGRIGKFVQNPFFKLTKNYHSDDISTDKNLVSDVSDFLIKNKNNFQGILS